MIEEDEVMIKSGPDLFTELLRIYPVAEVDDYFKNGQWKDDVMKMDFTLINAHRREAGSPNPPALADVKVPDLPVGVPPQGVGVVRPGFPGGARPGGAVTVVGRQPMGMTGGTEPAAEPAQQAASPVAELRLIALFVAKWRLDPTKAKMMLAKMTPPTRRFVIQNFKTSAQGVMATTALENYIAQCERTNAWGAAVAAASPNSAAHSAPAPHTQSIARPSLTVGGVGVKRPFSMPGVVIDHNKRPRIGPGPMTPGPQPASAGTTAAQAALANRLASIRGAVATGPRPVGPRPGAHATSMGWQTAPGAGATAYARPGAPGAGVLASGKGSPAIWNAVQRF